VKRLNPKTGKVFKHGNVREDGFIFVGYNINKIKDNYFREFWKDPINYQLYLAFKGAKERAKRKNIPFNLEKAYLKSIMTSLCPVFKIPLTWGVYGEGNRNIYNSPSLDRVVPELGYIKGNVVFLSGLANMIKQDVTETELYAVADWLHDKRKEVLNAVKNQAPSLPAESYIEGEIYPELGAISSAGTREDSYDLDHYQRTVSGQDSDYRTQTRGGDSVGHRGAEVGTPQAPQSEQNNGISYGKIVSYEELCRHIFDKP
jgi:hypothetical protein